MPQVLQESKKPVIVIKDNYQNIVSKKNKSALIPEELPRNSILYT